ncbi:hypothetical protein [Xanthobacter sp. 126]|nr:hypothetical protein [Xanthobacter sp. 126]
MDTRAVPANVFDDCSKIMIYLEVLAFLLAKAHPGARDLYRSPLPRRA